MDTIPFGQSDFQTYSKMNPSATPATIPFSPSDVPQQPAQTQPQPTGNNPSGQSGANLGNVIPAITSTINQSEQGMTSAWQDAYDNASQTLKNASTENPLVAGTHLAGDVGEALLAPFGAAMNILTGGKVGDTTSGIGDAIANNPKALPILNNLNDYFDKNPDAKRIIFNDIPNILNLAVAGAGVAEVAPEMAENNPVSTIKAGVENMKATPEEVAAKQTQTSVQSNTDALNPDLTGKAKISAYKNVALGNREIQPSGILREQGLSPSDQTVQLAKNIQSDITTKSGQTIKGITLKGNNPVANLKTIGDGFTQTENALTTELKGDPEINYNLDKPSLQEKLTRLVDNMPDEFKSIKNMSENQFSRVVSFAKGIVDKADDSITGGRNARTSFDSAAKQNYPSAFKNGFLDNSTPAGRAIQSVRNTMNEHLYETAPNGSDIQTLIGREADLYRALDPVARKAAQMNGLNSVQVLIKRYPTLSKYLGWGLKLVGAGALLNEGGKLLGI